MIDPIAEIRETLAGASPEALRELAEGLAVELAELRGGARKLVATHRAIHNLLTSGRIDDAAKLSAWVVAACDAAMGAAQAEANGQPALGEMPPEGSA